MRASLAVPTMAGQGSWSTSDWYWPQWQDDPQWHGWQEWHSGDVSLDEAEVPGPPTSSEPPPPCPPPPKLPAGPKQETLNPKP